MHFRGGQTINDIIAIRCFDWNGAMCSLSLSLLPLRLHRPYTLLSRAAAAAAAKLPGQRPLAWHQSTATGCHRNPLNKSYVFRYILRWLIYLANALAFALRATFSYSSGKSIRQWARGNAHDICVFARQSAHLRQTNSPETSIVSHIDMQRCSCHFTSVRIYQTMYVILYDIQKSPNFRLYRIRLSTQRRRVLPAYVNDDSNKKFQANNPPADSFAQRWVSQFFLICVLSYILCQELMLILPYLVHENHHTPIPACLIDWIWGKNKIWRTKYAIF